MAFIGTAHSLKLLVDFRIEKLLIGRDVWVSTEVILRRPRNKGQGGSSIRYRTKSGGDPGRFVLIISLGANRNDNQVAGDPAW
jgi:hypothetical protein